MAKSTDGGDTFENFMVSDSSFTPQASVFFGDYINIAALNGKVYPIWMRLDQMELSVWTALIDDSTTVNIADEGKIADRYVLMKNYPNPFNPSTTIRFTLPEISAVSLVVYDLMGREIVDLAQGEYQAGSQQIRWDGRDQNGVPVASGVYFATLESTSKESNESYNSVQKMVLMK
ncbi:MAG: FlgD immunoglobulin-like domain containing protein [Fidelibacterota bacterium]